jgi:pyruvate,orthophosphate dikinase
MGVRGVRLTATFPEVTNIQVEAIVNAAIDVNNEGVQVKPTILVPMVTSDRELVAAIDLINDIGLKV